MAFKPGAFNYASAYSQGFGDDIKPITPGTDLSSGGVTSLADAAAGNFESASSFASAGLEATAAKKKADVLAKSYLDQAKLINDQANAKQQGGLFGGIGKLIGGVVSLIPGGQIPGALISGASGLFG